MRQCVSMVVFKDFFWHSVRNKMAYAHRIHSYMHHQTLCLTSSLLPDRQRVDAAPSLFGPSELRALGVRVDGLMMDAMDGLDGLSGWLPPAGWVSSRSQRWREGPPFGGVRPPTPISRRVCQCSLPGRFGRSRQRCLEGPL